MREERLRRDLQTLQRQAGALLGRLSFAGLVEDVNRRQQALAPLGERVARVRARGYTWYGNLEDRLDAAEKLVPAAQRAARDESAAAAESLRPRVDALAEEARTIASRGDLLASEAVTACRHRQFDLPAAQRIVIAVSHAAGNAGFGGASQPVAKPQLGLQTPIRPVIDVARDHDQVGMLADRQFDHLLKSLERGIAQSVSDVRVEIPAGC